MMLTTQKSSFQSAEQIDYKPTSSFWSVIKTTKCYIVILACIFVSRNVNFENMIYVTLYAIL